MSLVGIYYWWYEFSKSYLESHAVKTTGRRRPLTTAESILAGFIAGSATVILTNPIWVVNTRQTARKDADDQHRDIKDLPPAEAAKEVAQRATGFVRMLLDIVKTEGLGALWSGVIPGLVLVINPIIQYTVFEQLKNMIEQKRSSRLTPNDAFVLGALGKLLATGITYPYSTISRLKMLIAVTIKARMQLKQSNDVSQQYKGTIAGLRKIIKDEGLNGLYKGTLFRDVQSDDRNRTQVDSIGS
jgi:solute carrier family 25 (peroxisomal adenine nucleotide transporter), member 17